MRKEPLKGSFFLFHLFFLDVCASENIFYSIEASVAASFPSLVNSITILPAWKFE
jgi:hypothetical protein